MYKKISVTLADGEQGEMACLANGATAIRYRQTFKEDLLTGISVLLQAIGEDSLVKTQREQRRKEQAQLQGQEESEEKKTQEQEDEEDKEQMRILLSVLKSGKLGMVSELAYVMNMQAKAKDENNMTYASRMNVEDYIAWLEEYDSMSFLTGAIDFISLYIGNKAGGSTPKKEDAQLKGQ